MRAPDDRKRPAIASTVRQTVASSAYVDGVSLKATARSKGKVRVSGRVSPARRGAKVTFVTRPAASEERVDSVFSFPATLFTPKDGLRTVGSTVDRDRTPVSAP